MNKFYLITLAVLFTFFARTQHHHHHDDEMYCSKAKLFESYFENAQTIVQTHLLHEYDVKHYFLDINVLNNSIYVDGEVTFLAEVVAPQLDTFAFELLDEMTITQVLINDVNHSFDRLNDEVFVPVISPIQNAQLFSVKIVYGGTPPTGGFFSGISTALDSSGLLPGHFRNLFLHGPGGPQSKFWLIKPTPYGSFSLPTRLIWPDQTDS